MEAVIAEKEKERQTLNQHEENEVEITPYEKEDITHCSFLYDQ